MTLFLIVYADPALKDSYSRANERLDDLLLMLANNLIASEQKKLESKEVIRHFSKKNYSRTISRAVCLVRQNDEKKK